MDHKSYSHSRSADVSGLLVLISVLRCLSCDHRDFSGITLSHDFCLMPVIITTLSNIKVLRWLKKNAEHSGKGGRESREAEPSRQSYDKRFITRTANVQYHST